MGEPAGGTVAGNLDARGFAVVLAARRLATTRPIANGHRRHGTRMCRSSEPNVRLRAGGGSVAATLTRGHTMQIQLSASRGAAPRTSNDGTGSEVSSRASAHLTEQRLVVNELLNQ